MWIPPEVPDPILLHHPTRKSVGYFGGVRLRDGKLVARQEPACFDGATGWTFVKHLRHASALARRRVVVIADNASCHHSRVHRAWRTAAVAAFEVFYLEPYSPDLNPRERGWTLTRFLCTHNRYFPQLGQLTEAVDTQFATWAAFNDLLRRLCAII